MVTRRNHLASLFLLVALAWTAGSGSSAAESYLLRQAQAAHPGPDLVLFRGLDRLAGRRAVEISSSFQHARFWTRLGAYGVHDWLHACEIIGWNNYPDDLSPGAVWSMFMASPEHRSCIVWGGYDAVGVGSWKIADGRKFYAILFTDQVERRVVSGKWLRSRPWGTKLRWLPAGSRLVQFNHRRDSAGRLWVYVWVAGRYGWVAAYGTRII